MGKINLSCKSVEGRNTAETNQN